jgi:hypothetical protein
LIEPGNVADQLKALNIATVVLDVAVLILRGVL